MLAALLAVEPGRAASQSASPFDVRDLREWLTYIASDELQGRATFSAGLGLAASYIEQHLREWGVKPGGDNGSYLQTVRVVGVKSTSHSTVTVDVGGERRTFAGDAVRFPRNAGANQRLTLDRVESDHTSTARDINFDPLVLPAGIATSDDPLLSARSAVYSQSYTRRAGERKQPSAITPAEVGKGE